MLTILEGPDGSGKTTLAEYLTEHTERPILHSPGLRHGRDEMIAWVLKRLSSPDRDDYILDRFPLISELVYGPIIRSGAELNFGHALYSAWYQTPTTVIYCRPPYDVIEQEAKKKETEALMKKLPQIVRGYDHIMAGQLSANLKGKTQVSIITYDYTVDSPETILELTTQRRDGTVLEHIGSSADRFRRLKQEILR